MSVWLCRQEFVKWPLYIRELDIRIYSSQELSYVIIHNPLLALEGFVNESLLAFISEQLEMGFLSLKMERLKKAGESDDEILCLFLQEADYCTPAEITQFRQRAAVYRKMKPSEYRKARADYLFQTGQYMKAAVLYGKILEMPRDSFINDTFIGAVLGNMGTCYARLQQYERAAKAYEKSFLYTKDTEVLKCLYFLTAMDPQLPLSEHGQALLQTEIPPEWEEDFAKCRLQVTDSEEYQRLGDLFQRDQIRRQQGAEELIGDWKRKYRRMQNPS